MVIRFNKKSSHSSSSNNNNNNTRIITTEPTIIHFNNAGASPSPPVVVRAVARHMAHEVIMGGYLAARRARTDLDNVYSSVARLINAQCHSSSCFGGEAESSSPQVAARREIALVESATVGWTRIFYSMVRNLAVRAERDAVLAASNSNEEATGTTAEAKTQLLVILMSEAEYAANVVAAVKFAREQNDMTARTGVRWKVLSIPSSTYTDGEGRSHSTGIVDLDALDDMLSGRFRIDDGNDGQDRLDPESIAMVCVTHIPTNSGIINPVEEIGSRIAAFNDRWQVDDDYPALPRCFYLVDACQSAGQINIDVHTMKCHALAATGRKFIRGPRGTGFLYVRGDVADELVPTQVDHSAAPVERVPRSEGGDRDDRSSAYTCSYDLTGNGRQVGLEFCYQPGAAAFEFWESNVANKLGLGAAIDYALDSVGMQHIEKECCRLGDVLRSRLRSMDGITVYHDNADGTTRQCGIVVFTVDGVESGKVEEAMIESSDDSPRQFEVSVVPATSTPVDSANTLAGDMVRASVSYSNTLEEIELFVKKLHEVILTKPLRPYTHT